MHCKGRRDPGLADTCKAHASCWDFVHLLPDTGNVGSILELVRMRPWFCGQDSEKRWRSEGMGECEDAGVA
ncbi:hypothetical protein PISMIDRAFT_687178 [Pisolithus microcarpus 441]|uniref:Uncharacterized protein n=1 Tax=Pisolithus microcarpus 441 TaxID=765257 RepID=A0A0C9Z6H8_9AGAM|nr:hypothetical protein BKA83DRAFT_687178 [Pisolithus microcarpus]KIK15493.1 hypothetical protein PISMIDRAFT_687178 [Pisolithus microcarpus 441]